MKPTKMSERDLVGVTIVNTLMTMYDYNHDDTIVRGVAHDSSLYPLHKRDRELISKHCPRADKFIEIVSQKKP